MMERNPIKWAKEAHAYIDGIEVEFQADTAEGGKSKWLKAGLAVNPITHPCYEWRIAVPQWRKELAEKMKAGGVLEYYDFHRSTSIWIKSLCSVEEVLNPEVDMEEQYYRVPPEPQPKPDVVETWTFTRASFYEDLTSRANLKVIWDGTTGKPKAVELIK